jgi:hypothetical protein
MFCAKIATQQQIEQLENVRAFTEMHEPHSQNYIFFKMQIDRVTDRHNAQCTAAQSTRAKKNAGLLSNNVGQKLAKFDYYRMLSVHYTHCYERG